MPVVHGVPSQVAPGLAFFHTHHGIGYRFDPEAETGTQIRGGRAPRLPSTPRRST